MIPETPRVSLSLYLRFGLQASTPHCTLHSTPNTMHHTTYTIQIHHTPYVLHPTPCIMHHAPYTLHPTPYTLHPTPHTLHPTPYALDSMGAGVGVCAAILDVVRCRTDLAHNSHDQNLALVLKPKQLEVFDLFHFHLAGSGYQDDHPTTALRFRANFANIRQSRPDYGLGFIHFQSEDL